MFMFGVLLFNYVVYRLEKFNVEKIMYIGYKGWF